MITEFSRGPVAAVFPREVGRAGATQEARRKGVAGGLLVPRPRRASPASQDSCWGQDPSYLSAIFPFGCHTHPLPSGQS